MRHAPTVQETGYLLLTLYLVFVGVSALTATHIVLAAFVFILLAGSGIAVVVVASADVTAIRTVDRKALTAGGRVSVEVRISSKRWLPALEVYDEVSSRLRIRKGSNYAFAPLKPDDALVLRYEVESVVRGAEDIGPLIVRFRGPLSVFQRRARVLEPTVVRVYPRPEIVGAGLHPRRSRLKKSGPLISRHLGIGTEFYALREYLPGDSYSQINWRSTARLGRPVVNEFETETRQPVAIFLDSRAPTKTGYVESNALEQCVVVADSLAEQYIKAQHRVGLVVISDHAQWVFPDQGRRQLMRIREQLLVIQPAGTKPLRHWAFMTRRLLPKRGGRIIIVTPDVADPSLVDAVWRWVAGGHEVVVVIPSLLGLQTVVDEQATDVDRTRRRIAESALALRQEAVAFNLRRLGAQVFVWYQGQPLGAETGGRGRAAP